MMIERRKEEDLLLFFSSQIDFNDDFDEHLLMWHLYRRIDDDFVPSLP